MNKPKELPSLEYLNECFELDPNGPTGLLWKERPISHFKSVRSFNLANRNKGKPAGCVSSSKCGIQVKLSNSIYRVHRIVYCMFHNIDKIDEDLVIDHINRNPLDNDPENLRLISTALNMLNCVYAKNSKSKFPHVYGCKDTWHVSLKVNKKSKFFGAFKNLEDAKVVAREKSLEYYGEFSPFVNGTFQE